MLLCNQVILLFHILHLYTTTLLAAPAPYDSIAHLPTTNATDVTTTSPDYVVTEPWCEWKLNFVTYSYAFIIPYDGSPTTKGVDEAGQCGQRLNALKLSAKGVAATEWYCHYGPYDSACVTFNSALLPHPPHEVEKAYKGVVGKDLKCTKTPDDKDAVCPSLFPK